LADEKLKSRALGRELDDALRGQGRIGFAEDCPGSEVVCDWSGRGSDCGEGRAVEIRTFAIGTKFVELIPPSGSPPTATGPVLAHPPRQPGQTLREELELKAKKREIAEDFS
jgi:hypothetical protein